MVEKGKGFAELLPLIFWKPGHCFGKGFDPPLTAFPHETDSLVRCFEADAPAIFGCMTPDQP